MEVGKMTLAWWHWAALGVSWVVLGCLVGLHAHFRFWRHVARAHRGERTSSGCWCSTMNVPGDVVLVASYFAPLVWPIIVAVYVIVALFLFTPWLRLRNRVKEIATWEGRIANAHPEARPGNGTGRDAGAL